MTTFVCRGNGVWGSCGSLGFWFLGLLTLALASAVSCRAPPVTVVPSLTDVFTCIGVDEAVFPTCKDALRVLYTSEGIVSEVAVSSSVASIDSIVPAMEREGFVPISGSEFCVSACDNSSNIGYEFVDGRCPHEIFTYPTYPILESVSFIDSSEHLATVVSAPAGQGAVLISSTGNARAVSLALNETQMRMMAIGALLPGVPLCQAARTMRDPEMVVPELVRRIGGRASLGERGVKGKTREGGT